MSQLRIFIDNPPTLTYALRASYAKGTVWDSPHRHEDFLLLRMDLPEQAVEQIALKLDKSRQTLEAYI